MPKRAPRRCLRPGCSAMVDGGYCPDHPPSRVTLVCGPPLSGKSTLVRKRAKRGDLIVDFDALGAAVSGQPHHQLPHHLLPYAAAARDAVLERIAERRGGAEPPAVWVIAGLPERGERDAMATRLGAAEVVVLTTPAEECIGRLVDDPDGRPPQAVANAVRAWFSRYTP